MYTDEFFDGIGWPNSRSHSSPSSGIERCPHGFGRIDAHFKEAPFVGLAFVDFAIDREDITLACERDIKSFDDQTELRGRSFLDELMMLIGGAVLLPAWTFQDSYYIVGQEHIRFLRSSFNSGFAFQSVCQKNP